MCVYVSMFVCMMYIMISGKIAFKTISLYGSSKVPVTNFGSNFISEKYIIYIGWPFAQLKFGDSINKRKMEELILKISYSLNTLQEVS